MNHPTLNTPTGRITLEYWTQEQIPFSTSAPDGRTTLDSFSVLSGWTQQHSVCIRGHLHPPTTGDYVFTSSGHIDLYLDESNSEAPVRKIISATDTLSQTISLNAEKKYAITAQCKAHPDNTETQIGWHLPDGTQHEVIDGAFLSPHNAYNTIPQSHEILSNLSRQHPRVLASPYDFTHLHNRIQNDDQTAEWYAVIKQQAQDALNEPLPEYTYTDPYAVNFEGRGNQLIQMMENLGFVYNIEIQNGDLNLANQCADRAWQELELASHFEHWDTEHFASTARMAHAYGMGYDWFYNAFTPDQRAIVRKAIVELGLKKYADEFNTGPFGWHQWTILKGNWNCAINGDTGIALLAVATENDYLSQDLFHKLLVNVQNFSMMTYYPDGGTKESPSYWRYKDQYFLPLFPALESTLGTDFGLLNTAGFSQTGAFPIHSMGPSGQFFNYSDGGPFWQATPSLLYLSRAFNIPLYAWVYRNRFPNATSVRSILWHDDRGSAEDRFNMPLNQYYSDAEVVYLRGDWHDPNTSWVGFAATDNWDFIHGQLDQGTFVFDALGERWATDFGADNYGLPGYWDKDTGGIRWKAYRIRAEGHNTLVINPGTTHEDQHPMARGKIVEFSANEDNPFAIADLTDAYKQNGALKVRRGIKLCNRSTLLIRDELTLATPSEVWWFLHTQANINIADDGKTATLSQNDKQVKAHLLDAPDNVKFLAMDAERLPTSPAPTPGELGAEGYRKLTIKAEDTTQFTLTVALIPQGATDTLEPPTQPLSSWATDALS